MNSEIVKTQNPYSVLFRTIVVCMLLVCLSCGSSFDATNKSVDAIYKRAVEEFDDNDLFEAQKLFDLIKLQYPASEYADDAQYYLASINYKRKEYVLAAFNYNYLRRQYPQSNYSKEALYKAAICYVELSPPFDRDQDYTRKAILALNDFQKEYPKDSLSIDADNKIKTLRNKLAEREYRIAEQYRILLAPRASLVYFDAVIDDYPDTEFGESSFVNKIEILTELKRYDEALSTCSLYDRFYPTGANRKRVSELRSSIPTDASK